MKHNGFGAAVIGKLKETKVKQNLYYEMKEKVVEEQTYHGRCLVAYDKHVNDLNELDDEQRNLFMADVADVTRAMQRLFKPEKINYGAYSDKLSHLHFHLAPKYVDGPDYGGTFQMNPGKVYLSDAEYAEMVSALRKELLG